MELKIVDKIPAIDKKKYFEIKKAIVQVIENLKPGQALEITCKDNREATLLGMTLYNDRRNGRMPQVSKQMVRSNKLYLEKTSTIKRLLDSEKIKWN